MKNTAGSERHLQLYATMSAKLAEASRRFDDISAMQQLAVLCNIVGKLIAFQDASKYSPAMVMEMVARNIEQGNLEAVQGLMNFKGSA